MSVAWTQLRTKHLDAYPIVCGGVEVYIVQLTTSLWGVDIDIDGGGGPSTRLNAPDARAARRRALAWAAERLAEAAAEVSPGPG